MTYIAVIDNTLSSALRFRSHLIARLAQNHTVKVFLFSTSDPYPQEKKDALERQGVEFVDVQANPKTLNGWRHLHCLGKLFCLLFKDRPSVILNYTIKANIYGSLVGGCLGVREIYSTITGLGEVFVHPAMGAVKRVACLLYKIAFSLNRKVIVQNEDDGDYLVKAGCVSQQKIAVVSGSGVDTHFYSFSPPPLLSDGSAPVVFLCVGRLLKSKGILEFIESCEILKARIKNRPLHFMLLGTPYDSPSALSHNQILSLRHHPFIHYIEFADDLRPYYKACHVFVLPSYREGISRAILEAMATGRPIVTTDVPGCRQTTVNGLNGFLVPPRDATALAEALETFVQRNELIQRMGEESRKRAEALFDVQRVTEHVMQIIGPSLS